MSSCQLFVSVFVNAEKHRWKESNPRDAGLESGPQTIAHRREVKTKQKSRLPPGARLRRLLENSPLGGHPAGPPVRGLSSSVSW